MNIFEKLPNIIDMYKGKVELELIDDLTGKTIEKIEKENTLTTLGKNYLLWAFKEPLYRWFPGWAANTQNFGSKIRAGREPFYPFEYIVLTDYNGPIDPSADVEVKGNIAAFAVKNEYVGSDTKRGRMDSIETKEIPNGIQYVFLWSTYQGNGPINSVYWATLNPNMWYDLYDVEDMGTSVPNATATNIRPYILTGNILKTPKINANGYIYNINDLEKIILNGTTYYYACAYNNLIGRFDENLNSLGYDSSVDNSSNDTYYSLAAHNNKLYVYNVYLNRICRFAPNPSTGALAGTKEKTWAVPSGTQGQILIKDNVLYHLRNDRKVYAFNLATIDSKPDMQNANADAVYDLSSFLPSTSYYGFKYDSEKDSMFIVVDTELYEFSTDFKVLKKRRPIMPYTRAGSSSNRGLVIYNGKLHHLNANSEISEFIWGCAGARVLLPQTINKDSTNLLKLTYTFAFTS